MSERFSVILTRLRERFAQEADVAEVEAYLSSEGFDRGQIGTIVSEFLAGAHLGASGGFLAEQPALRVLGPHEQGRIAPEAWGYLLALRVGGALSATELEGVLERALAQGDGRVGLEDLRSVLEGVGIEPGDVGPGRGTIH
jgi:uncharacterized protein Smg (DUF494 family)